LVTCRDLKLTLAVNAAITPRRPLLIKSEPGTGKTMLAEEVATSLGLPLFEWHVKSTTQRSRGSTNTMLSRAALVKDETHFDKFDRAFGEYFKGVEALPGMDVLIPEAWLRQAVKQHLSDAERARLEKLGWDKLMETFIVSKSARATHIRVCEELFSACRSEFKHLDAPPGRHLAARDLAQPRVGIVVAIPAIDLADLPSDGGSDVPADTRWAGAGNEVVEQVITWAQV